jgi:hypothetical protein
MPLPQDYDTLCRWRCFVIKWWLMDINIWFSCVHAVMLGMNMRRADFLKIVKEYCDASSENQTYGRRRK